MTHRDLAFASALELAELIRAKEVSPVELVELYGERIERLNPVLAAYLTPALDQARDVAREKETALGADYLPVFHGVPIAIKDLNDTAGIRTTHGSAGFSDRVPEADDETVRRIRAAGFVILGKTNTPEFGTTPWTEPDGFPPARNPWDTDRTPGGSSGGSAAALAAGLCPVSQGSDGGGSIRIPASCCGLYGIKPSRGRVTSAPAAQSFLSQNGPIARTVADAAALLDALAGYATGDAFWAPHPERPFRDEVGRDPGRLRVAWTADAGMGATVAPGNRRGAEEAAGLLSELGHDVTEQAPPSWPDELVQDFLLTWSVRTDAYEPSPPDEGLGAVNRAVVEIGRAVPASTYEAAVRRIQRAARRIVAFFDDYDVLVTPTVAIPPPRIGEFRDPDSPLAEFLRAVEFVPFTPPWNTTGQPAVSVPLATDESGLPVGVQIVGRPADEATLVRVSAQLEQARPWRDRRPPVA